jgi:hypothetical protein
MDRAVKIHRRPKQKLLMKIWLRENQPRIKIGTKSDLGEKA